jgi:purine-binding chemotaxis protein CheW
MRKEHTRNLLIFQANGLNCAFPVEAVREIVPMARLSVPPGLPSCLAGFLDLRGVAIPIARLDRLFDLPEQRPGLNTPLIILRSAAVPIGILVNYVRSIAQVSFDRLLDIPHDCSFGGFAKASVDLDGAPVYLLSAADLFQANENRLLAG